MNQLSVFLATSLDRSLCYLWLFLPLIGDLYPENEKDKDTEEPDWVKTEREHFTEFRDKNKDGKMDRVCLIILQSLKYCHTFYEKFPLWIPSSLPLCWSTSTRKDLEEGFAHIKRSRMLAVSLRDVNPGFWSHLGSMTWNTTIFNCQSRCI